MSTGGGSKAAVDVWPSTQRTVQDGRSGLGLAISRDLARGIGGALVADTHLRHRQPALFLGLRTPSPPVPVLPQPLVEPLVTAASPAAPRHAHAPRETLARRLNGPGHERSLQLFMAIVLAHWAEHLAQAMQVYVLRWPADDAGGMIGLWFPWLVTSESLHYAYALVMLVGLWLLRTGFVGRARTWWMVAFWIQFWHHIEHALLQGQVIAGRNLLDAPVPMSVAQFFIPRIELHMIYNTIVFVPMMIAMYVHLLPTAEERAGMRCTCAILPELGAA
jgi:hypothetical protein